MKVHKAQEWADFLQCYIVIYHKEVFFLDNFPKDIKFFSSGEIASFSPAKDSVFDLGSAKVLILEADMTNQLYTHKLTYADRVFVWNDQYSKDFFPQVKRFSNYTDCHKIEVINDIKKEEYYHFLRFDKELSGLTIEELQKKLNFKDL